MALIKPTFPALVGPTLAATADGGGLPWERRGGAPPPTAWLPSDITGVAEWWRADLGVTDAGGGAVSAWQGQIAGETLSQGTSSARPTLTTRDGQSVLSFDGGDYLGPSTFSTVSLSVPWQMLVVAQASATGTINATDGDSVARRALIGMLSTGTVWRTLAASGSISGGTWDTSPHLLGTKVTGSTDSALILDDLSTPLATGTLGGTPPQGLVVGANYDGSAARWTGWIWEVILVDAAISAGDLALLGAYLDARYAGLSLTY